MDTVKNIRFILSVSWLALALVFGLFLSAVITDKKPVQKELEEFSRTTSLSTTDSLFASIQLGKNLFKANCVTCHNKNMKTNMTGPALLGTRVRWKEFPQEDLYNWVRNSQKLILEKHPRALALSKSWNGSVMNRFPNLSNEDIEAVLNYIESRN